VKSTARASLRALSVGLTMLAPVAAADAAPQAHQHIVTMAHMNYGRLPGDVHAGDTIVWVNRDTVPHTVTARDKSFDLRIAPGKSATMIARKAGSFPFFCIYHAQMRGTLEVAR
jgi:plastocyanin